MSTCYGHVQHACHKLAQRVQDRILLLVWTNKARQSRLPAFHGSSCIMHAALHATLLLINLLRHELSATAAWHRACLPGSSKGMGAAKLGLDGSGCSSSSRISPAGACTTVYQDLHVAWHDTGLCQRCCQIIKAATNLPVCGLGARAHCPPVALQTGQQSAAQVATGQGLHYPGLQSGAGWLVPRLCWRQIW